MCKAMSTTQWMVVLIVVCLLKLLQYICQCLIQQREIKLVGNYVAKYDEGYMYIIM